MDIKLEAPKHQNQELLKGYYDSLLNKKYGKYPFINTIDIAVKAVENKYKVSLLIKPEKGKSLYAEGINQVENRAAYEAILKMNRLIEKYKERHYHKKDNTHKLIGQL